MYGQLVARPMCTTPTLAKLTLVTARRSDAEAKGLQTSLPGCA